MGDAKRGILVVSFGTSYAETRKKTIEQIELEIQKSYPLWKVYRAWTSSFICRKLLARDGMRILNVPEALEQMRSDGITEVVVQPTHMISGLEHNRMLEEIRQCQGWFDSVTVGAPLLYSERDQEQVIRAVVEQLQPGGEEALVLMGHGTEHEANEVYEQMNQSFRELDYPNIFMGTVEASPAFESVLQQVNEMQPARVVLAPFMIVAGDHASHDLAGDADTSWKSRFEQAGYEVTCVLKGLGEYPGVRKILLEHVAEAMAVL